MLTCTSGSEFSSLQRDLIGRCFFTSTTASVLVAMALRILRQEGSREGDWESNWQRVGTQPASQTSWHNLQLQ